MVMILCACIHMSTTSSNSFLAFTLVTAKAASDMSIVHPLHHGLLPGSLGPFVTLFIQNRGLRCFLLKTAPPPLNVTLFFGPLDLLKRPL